MSQLRLVPCRLLDPRPAAEAAKRPIHSAVNIPADELATRVHELPPRGRLIRVANVASGEAAVKWLRSNGRKGNLTPFRYRPPDEPWPYVGRLWHPSRFLSATATRLEPGRALDVACGTGRDAVYLAGRGWDVTGVDILPDALTLANDLARRCASAIRPIHWHCADLETLARGTLADALPGAAESFDLIIIFYYLHRPLLARLHEWLQPGGSALCEMFTELHRARHGRPRRDEHVTKADVLPALLHGLEVRHHSEDWRHGIHTARTWAVRPLRP